MNLVDIVLVLAGVLAVTRGWQIGIIRGAFGLAGLFGGAWFAFQGVPVVLDSFSLSTLARIASGIGLIAVIALIGESVGSAVGAVVRRAFSWTPVRLIDSALGAAFRVASLAAIVWLLASALSILPDRGVVHQVRASRIVSMIDGFAPEVLAKAGAAFRSAMHGANFPIVFADLTPRLPQQVKPASPKVLQDPDVVAAYASVYKVESDADDCMLRISGTGFVYAPDRIMTNAHVVAGANFVTVSNKADPVKRSARVVYFDPKLDIAVLEVRGLRGAPLAFASDARAGMQAVIPGYTGGGPMTPDAARISDVILARGHTIYGTGRVDREIVVMRADVASGDSGSPVLGLDGQVLGLVFAAAADDNSTGYALTNTAVQRAAADGRSAESAVPTGRCIDG